MANDSEVQSVIFGFGHRARSGKDTAAAWIKLNRGKSPLVFEGYDIRIYSFAQELKREMLSLFFNKETHYWKFLDGEQNRKGPRMGPLESFFSRVNCTEGCWLWTGKANDTGYGIVYTPEKEVKAHRFIWERVLGLEPVQLLRHRCDNRLCVNPTHLLEGTLQQNSQDMCDRVRYAHGENYPQATLSDKEIGHIEDLYDVWGMTQAELSRAFNVSSSTISRVLSGKTRKNPKPVDSTVLAEKFSDVWLSDEHKAKFRKLLQFYGTEYCRAGDNNYWVKKVAARIAEEKPEVALITDMRFPNEMAFCQKYGNAIRVDRPGLPPLDGAAGVHASELALANVPDEHWDYIIKNDGTLEHFRDEVLFTFDMLMIAVKQ